MTVVQSRIVAPDGTGAPGWVTVRLLGPGLQPDSRVSVLSPLAFRSNADGSWSRDLLPNSEESPYYVVTEAADQGIPQQNLIHVEDSEAAVWLGDLVVRIPLPAGVSGLPYRGPEGQPGPPGPPGNISGAAFAEAVATQMNDGTPARVKLDGEYEPRIDRTGASAGQAVLLQSDGTLDFGTVVTEGGGGGTGTVTSVAGVLPVNGNVTLTAENVGAVTLAQVQALLANYVSKADLIIAADEPANTSAVWIDV